MNPAAVEDLLAKVSMSKATLAEAAQVTPGHLSDMLYRRKGTNPDVVRRMADALRCRPETIAPELTGHFVCIRDGAATTVAAS